ncbi:MAG: hypothetical protein ACOZAJ_01995 [Patescibacteria group bacterium]
MVKEKVINDPGRKINVSALPTTCHAILHKFDTSKGDQRLKFKMVKEELNSDSVLLTLNGYCGQTKVEKFLEIGGFIDIINCGKMKLIEVVVKNNQFSNKLFLGV